ncbi:MAG TPA: hypothetical protein VHO06_01980 [Polyangia bacterium]|nr:hypothetical protein [Polyangia bacterium]
MSADSNRSPAAKVMDEAIDRALSGAETIEVTAADLASALTSA